MQIKKYSCQDIIQAMSREIVGHRMASGVRLGTSQELMRRYGVSQRTIERALSELSQRGLISRKQGCGTFVQSSVASGSRGRVGVISGRFSEYLDVPSLHEIAFGRLLRSMQELLSGVGYASERFFMCREDLVDREKRQLLERILDSFDVVVLPAGLALQAGELVRRGKATKVLICGSVPVPGPWHQLVYDYRPGLAKAVRLFRRLGVRRLMAVGFEGKETSQERMEVFREEAMRGGYRRGDVVLHYEKAHALSILLPGQYFADFYLKNDLRDCGVFSTSDYLGIGMMLEFRRAGAVPGKEFQLISYDNFEGQMQSPEYQLGMTGITHPQDKVAGALGMLLDDLARPQSCEGIYRTYWIPADELVIRTSTGSNNQKE